jgi:hypothetical protein
MDAHERAGKFHQEFLVRGRIDERRAKPTDDFTSFVVTAQVEGRALGASIAFPAVPATCCFPLSHFRDMSLEDHSQQISSNVSSSRSIEWTIR